ncbi:hypothetical protein GCM10025768_03300 [Microbacterium pseudoresistens]|uniref:Uncharacterized protein n=1 Tax=Microbacterium pseudoresistens TaxID=640634 RepID=A0A7Y9EUR7_9MICO|nr:hypothetical protein [Microbacterium pseudoresistens]NYD54166.1 hypothetical protein [Microbacterium pseudoresistens]
MQQPRAGRRRASARLSTDLALLAVIGLVLIAALAAGAAAMYRSFYSPSAFVQHYLGLISEGRAADALQVSGVALERTAQGHADIDTNASDALLRQAALSTLTDIAITDEHRDGDDTVVTASYVAGGHDGSTTFRVRQDGWIGVVPAWRFSTSPLAVIELTLRGSEQFTVNGFELDRRQVAAAGVDAPPLEPVPLLVFSPGLYSVSVDTAIAKTKGVSLLADTPLATTPLDLQAEATKEFIAVVQEQVDSFLTQCTTQQVLQPTSCPFGMAINNRITELPTWSIVAMPQVTVVPDGANWKIPPTSATAHITVEVQSLFDGSITEMDEDVPFRLDGTIVILPDGSASISVGSPDLGDGA